MLAVVAVVTESVFVGVGGFGRIVGAGVETVGHQIPIDVVIAHVAEGVPVEVGLIGVRDGGAVVAGVADAVAIGVLLGRVGGGGAVVQLASPLGLLQNVTD